MLLKSDCDTHKALLLCDARLLWIPETSAGARRELFPGVRSGRKDQIARLCRSAAAPGPVQRLESKGTMIGTTQDLCEKLRGLSSQLKDLEKDLKSLTVAEIPVLHEFRSALDSARLTAWTASELLHARQNGVNVERMQRFLTAERVRRITEMANELCSDMREGGVTMQSPGMRFLADGLRGLLFRLDGVGNIAVKTGNCAADQPR
jgi:hypothetical protein